MAKNKTKQKCNANVDFSPFSLPLFNPFDLFYFWDFMSQKNNSKKTN